MEMILTVLGFMVCLYALAEALGAANRKLEEENKNSFLQSALSVIVIGLLYCSAPIGIINMLHDSRIRKINDQENAKRHAALREIDARLICDLKEQVKSLEEEKLIIRLEEYDQGKKSGYQAGYVDGYIASCEESLSEADFHLQHDISWKQNTRSAALASLKFKERMDKSREGSHA